MQNGDGHKGKKLRHFNTQVFVHTFHMQAQAQAQAQAQLNKSCQKFSII